MAICAVGAHGLLKQSSYSVGFSQTLVVTTAHGAAFVSRAIVGEHDVCSEGSEESRQNRANRHQHRTLRITAYGDNKVRRMVLAPFAVDQAAVL